MKGHNVLVVSASAGVFTDGFGLGIVGIALSAAGAELHLTPAWLGITAAGSLGGLCVGALLTGPVADRYGRRTIFAYDMIALAVLSALQLFVRSPMDVLILRLLIGVVLGADYVVSKAMLAELSEEGRGRRLRWLSIAWVGGYAAAFGAGVALSSSHNDTWRWMLASAVLPAVICLPVRLSVTESRLWLGDRAGWPCSGLVSVDDLGLKGKQEACGSGSTFWASSWQSLWSPEWRRNTVVGCIFFSCQVIPYFALGTFVTKVLEGMHIEASYASGLIYNAFLLLGAVAGILVVDHISRRTFLVGSFGVTTVALLPMILFNDVSSMIVIVLFVSFAGVLSASQCLVYVYLPELFPTRLRASGVGVAIAVSRVASAAGTFLLPIILDSYGARSVLAVCAFTLAIGAIFCFQYAPETRNVVMD